MLRARAPALLASCVVSVFAPAAVRGQDPAPAAAEAPEQEDPTKAVFFSVRNEYFNLARGSWTNALIFRSDRIFLRTRPRLGGRAGILTRFDLPIVAARLGNVSDVGLGDLYVQALYVPWLTGRFAVAAGTGLTVPTATEKTLGLGKWQIAPALAPVWFLPQRKGLFFIRFHGHLSFAGDEDRREVRTLEIVPLLAWNFRRGWWTIIDTNARIDWEGQEQVNYRTGVELGRVVGRAWGVAIKPEIPWGPDRRGEWKVVALVTRFRRR
jgi:hypothetical protein